jgi:ClpP class serine protease
MKSTNKTITNKREFYSMSNKEQKEVYKLFIKEIKMQ